MEKFYIIIKIKHFWSCSPSIEKYVGYILTQALRMNYSWAML